MQIAKKPRSRVAKTSGLLIAAVSMLLTGSRASAAIVTTTVNLPQAQEVTLFGGSSEVAGINTSSGPGMFVGSDGNGPKRGLMEFDIADNIPAGATIQSVSLTLYLGMVAGSSGGPADPTAGDGKNTRIIQLFAATSPWHGTTIGTTGFPDNGSRFGGTGHGFGPANPGDSTWKYEYYDPTNPTLWKTAGGGGDFVSTPSASVTFTANVSSVVMTPFTWSSTGMVADVQGWLDGTMQNDGWLFKNTEESMQSFRAFYTAAGAVEQGHPNFAPVLAVTYSIPEPATLSLLATGSLLVLRRRRNVM